MPSKGVEVYCYICVEGVQVDFTVPGQTISKNSLNEWTSDHLEVEKSKLHGAFTVTGTFSFNVKHNGQEVTNQTADVGISQPCDSPWSQTGYLNCDITRLT
jgi:hypothetical protein